MARSAKVLLCVLDWGLGHATRSLALANTLKSQGFSIVIASSGQALKLLNIELRDCKFYELPSYGVTYSASDFVRGIVVQIPGILRRIRQERRAVNSIVE